MNKLEAILQKTKDIENNFKYKRVLFIGSESYDGPIITIIEGLHKLGFEILTYNKSNINSWFCNKIITNLIDIEKNVDFVLSNLHWGTRWDLYKEFNHKVLYILIDGDDDNNCKSWRDKYNKYKRGYKTEDINNIGSNELLSHRYMIDIDNYIPDIIFKTQKFTTEGIYLPFGINNSYIEFNQSKTTHQRQIDIAHFPGPGIEREKTTQVINNNLNKYNIINKQIYGEMIVDKKINNNCINDKNIHSWHRWKTCDKYFETINDSKICICEPAPGGWDSKRPWEILAQGSLLIYYKPVGFNDTEYSIDNISSYCKCKNYNDMIQKCQFLLQNQEILEEKRKECYENGIKYFTAEPIARYFLWNIIN